MGMRGGGTAPSSTVICERQALLVDGDMGMRGGGAAGTPSSMVMLSTHLQPKSLLEGLGIPGDNDNVMMWQRHGVVKLGHSCQ